jgi:phosphotriesterase-related protein
VLEEEGVDLRRVIVGHVQFWPDNDYHLELIRRGAFVAFDRMGTTNKTEFGIFVNAIKSIIEAGFAENIVLGQDICYRADYVSYGGNGYRYMPYKMKEDFLDNGISEEAYNLMVFENPRRALIGDN